MTFQRFLEWLLIWGLEKFGLFYGSYPGFVVDVDDAAANKDGENLGRIRALCVPLWGTEAPEDIWIHPKYGPFGPRHGLWWPPEVGDQVWIECRQGQPKYAEYVGGWLGKGDAFPDFTNNMRGFRTPKGWTLFFDDENQVHKLFSPSKDLDVELDDDAKKATIKVSGTVLEIDGNTDIVTITSASGVKIGSASAGQPLVLGFKLLTWLNSHTHNHPLGVTAPPVQPALPADILSAVHKTE